MARIKRAARRAGALIPLLAAVLSAVAPPALVERIQHAADAANVVSGLLDVLEWPEHHARPRR
jgi:hypothetical protein